MKVAYTLKLAALCFLLGVTAVSAQESSDVRSREFSKVGAGTGTFLSMPVGARAVGMGGGFAGVADDASAMYWNPGGLTLAPGVQAQYTFAPMFAGMTQNFAGVAFPLSPSYKLGISALAFSSGPIEVTDMFNQDGTGATYTVADLAFGATFAGQLTDQFSFGVTGKFVNLTIASQTASGVAFDLGTMYKPGILGLRIGFAISNLSTSFKYSGTGLVRRGDVDPETGNKEPDVELETTEATLPLTFRGGLSSDILADNDEHSLLMATEFSTSSDAPEHLSVGAEYVWNNLVSARAGYQFGSDVDTFGPTGGFGVRYQTGSFLATLDYAIRPHFSLGLVNQVTASVRFQ